MIPRRPFLALSAFLLTRGAAAQGFPDRPLRFLVAYAPGGPADAFARLIARAMGPRLNGTVVVENRPGGGGVIATEAAVRAAPDGHTLLLVDNGAVVYAPALFSRLPYDPDRDLTGIGFIGRFPLVLIVRANDPIRDWAGFLTAARAKAPTYGTGAVGSPQHLAMEFLGRGAGFAATHVPYRNSPTALQDLLAGAVDCMLTDSASAAGAIRAGTARPLLVMSPERVLSLPDVPTTKEVGLPDAVAYAWLGMSVPAATPAPVVTRLNAALNEAVASEEVANAMRAISAEPVPGPPAAFDETVRRESAVWRPLIRDLGIRQE